MHANAVGGKGGKGGVLEIGSLVDICHVAVVPAMPTTVADLYTIGADAMLARGGVTRRLSSRGTRLPQGIHLRTCVSV